MSIFTALLLAYAFERAHMIIAAPNYGSAWNGYGSIELTAQKKIKAPMAYRVLMPLLVTWTEKVLRTPTWRRIDIYQTYKILLTGLAFWSVAQAWGPAVAVATAVLMLLTIRFDYWSYAPELAGVALAMTGDLALAIPGAILFALSRETAPIVALIYYLITHDVDGTLRLLSVTGLVLILVRINVGKQPNYTGLWKLPENIKKYLAIDPETGRRVFFLYQPIYYSDIFIAALITILAAVSAFFHPAGLAVAAMLAAGWTFSLADETRVFIPVLPWVAALILGGLA